MSKEKEEKERTEKLKKLVLFRLKTMPPNFKLSVGDKGTFTKGQLIEHVQEEDETGKQIVDMQVNFIKAVTTGKLIQMLNN